MPGGTPAPPAADLFSTVQAAECLGVPEEGVTSSTYPAAAGGGDPRPAAAAARGQQGASLPQHWRTVQGLPPSIALIFHVA